MFNCGNKSKAQGGISKTLIALIFLTVTVVIILGSILAVTITFSIDIEKFKFETVSAQVDQQVQQNTINSSFDLRFQKIVQDFNSALQQQLQKQIAINSSFEIRLQKLRLEIGLDQQQQLSQQQKEINSSLEARILELDQSIDFTQLNQQSINTSFQIRLQELRKKITSSQQLRLEQQSAINSSFEMQLQEIIRELNSAQLQQSAVNSSLELRLQGLRQEFNSALQNQLDQQNSINSSFDRRLQDLSEELKSAQLQQLSQQNAINSSFQITLQELQGDIDLAQLQRNALNSTFRNDLQQLNEDINIAKEERLQSQNRINSSLQVLVQDILSLNYSIILVSNAQIVGDIKAQEDILQLNSSINELSQVLQQEISSRDGRIDLLNVSLIEQKINDTRATIQDIITNLERLGSLQTFPAPSCAALLSSLPSDFYWLRAANGSAVRVFCDMDLQCGNTTGWVRVAQLDFNSTNSSDPCPTGFVVRSDSNLNTCVPNAMTPTGCTQVDIFSAFGLSYSRVCGRVIAYQLGTPEAFSRSIVIRSLTIDSQYLDGISLTHGSGPREHIWSFPVGVTQARNDRFGCPCSNGYSLALPSFVGDNYFCDSAASSISSGTFYSDNPLFDGTGCNTMVTNCCSFNNPPWFYRQLPKSTSDDIEMRVCQDEGRSTEGILIQIIDLYIQ